MHELLDGRILSLHIHQLGKPVCPSQSLHFAVHVLPEPNSITARTHNLGENKTHVILLFESIIIIALDVGKKYCNILLNEVAATLPSSSTTDAATIAAACARLNVTVDDTFCVRSVGGLHGHPRWQCNMCPKFYATRNHLANHMLGLHYGVKPFACTVCHKTFNQATRLKFHMLSHSKSNFSNGSQRGERYSCSVCLRSFTQAMHLRRHLLTHDNKQPYSCRSCDKGFAIMSELQSHLQLHKQQQQQQNGDFAAAAEVQYAPKTDDELEAAVAAAAVAEGGEMRCNICARKFLFPSQLKDHMLTHTQVRRYGCAVCKMRFLKEHHLKAHCLTHTNIRAHKCDMCGRSFTLKGNLIRHLITHSKERAFECDICGKRFSQRQTLKTHLVIHADTKPYSCDVCGKALARAHNLKSHMSLHRQEKPFKCPLCNSAFTMKGNLHRHYKEKHKDVVQQHQQKLQNSNHASVDVVGHIVSSQCLVTNGRSHKDSHQLENMFSFGMYSQGGSDTATSGKKRKRSPRKRAAASSSSSSHHQMEPIQQQIPSGIANLTVLSPCGGHAMHTSGGTILNYYCNDSACACKFQGQTGYVGTSNGAACGSAGGGNSSSSSAGGGQQQLMQKLHSLHSAIDTLALSGGQGGMEKVSAIHVAIDEMVNASAQKPEPQPNQIHNQNPPPQNNFC